MTNTNQALLPKQVYHDITSHYNAYFNVNEKLQGVMELSEQSHKDKFDSVIPVYYYTNSKEFASYSSDLDDIIKRSTAAIQLHAPSNYTDDHFLIIGIAHYLKGDYDKATTDFKYITTQFKEGVDYVKVMRSLGKKVGKYRPAKRKPPVKVQVQAIVNKDGTQSLEKIDNRPEVSLWMHTPARSQALLWLIQSYTRQKKFDQASTVTLYTRNDNLFYKNYDPQLDLAEADLRVTQKKYADAIPPLEKYIDAKTIKHHKRLTVRPLFVLAQCYAAMGDNTKAISYYRRVLKSHPNYDMEFYAKLKMAKLARNTGGDNSAMRSSLLAMARDTRYKEYWDQIYYELALLSLSEKNRPDARKFLHQSVRNSTKNLDQKALSFQKLAEMDYEDESFVTAKYLYDSTLLAMSKSDVQYRQVEVRDKMLENLVKQLTIIAQEDSLQQLAQLSQSEREKYVRNAILKQQQAEEEKKAAEAALKQQQQLNNFQNSNPLNPNNPKPNTPSNGSSFYFYNESARAAGYNDFVKKWGNRSLEENWRRSNKSASAAQEDTTSLADTTSLTKDTSTVKSGSLEEKLLAGIPTTPEKMAKSVDKIVDAYYTAGTIYKDGLESYDKAAEMFETVNSKYPKHKLLLESYYNIYLISMKLKRTDVAQRYKDLILAEFPESVIAKVLRDPNYVNEAKNKEHAADDYYQSAYNDYATGKYDSAMYKCQMSDVVLVPNPLSSKFMLLSALILAKQDRLTDYVQALNKIINKSSDAEIKKIASELLQRLNKSKLQQIDLSKNPDRRDSLNSHYVMINAGKPDSSQMALQHQLDLAKEKAEKSGKFKPDTTSAKPLAANTPVAKDTSHNAASVAGTARDTATAKTSIVAVDTTSIYKRSDNDVHIFIIYIKDPTTTQSAIMATMASVDAYNSTQFPTKRLTSHQSVLDSKTRILTWRQFKNKDDVMAYYKAVISQTQLFSQMKPDQYVITAISRTNLDVLNSDKKIDVYSKFFNRVYQNLTK